MRVSGFYTSGAIGSTLVLLLLGKLLFNADAIGQLFFDFWLISIYAIVGVLAASASFSVVVTFRGAFGRIAEVGGFGLGLSYPLVLLVVSMMVRQISDSALTSMTVSSLLVGILSGLILSSKDKNA